MKQEKLSPGKETFVLSCANFATLIGAAFTVNALMFTYPLVLIPAAVFGIGAFFFGYAIGRDI